MVIRAFSYIRFSEPRQQWGDSLRRQSKLTEDYCTRKGLALDESLSLVDKGKSAYHGVNAAIGALSRFLECVKAKRVPKGSVLIIENLDRLSREHTLKAFNLFTGILEAGITIVTLSPEREYTYAETSGNVGLIMEAILSLFLGHEESRKKSERVQEEWRERLENIAKKGEKMTARVPSWLTLSEDRKSFIKIPHAVKTVKQIFTWCIDGVGVTGITRRLNKAGVPAIGRGKVWIESYVLLILRNRSVMGEYQSYTQIEGKKVPYGPVMPDYFPQVINQKTFYDAQKAMKSRKRMRGKRGKGEANLFTGLMTHAADRCSLHITHKKSGKRSLVSTRAEYGVKGTKYLSFPYEPFENAILTFLDEVKPSDLMPTEDNNEDMVSLLSGKVADLAHKIEQVKNKIDENPDILSFLDLLAKMERQHNEAIAELEKESDKNIGSNSETVGEIKTLVGLMRTLEGEEREEVRIRLKARLRLILDEIWTYFVEAPMIGSRGRTCKGRVAVIQLCFRNGKTRFVVVSSTLRKAGRIDYLEGEQDYDLRKSYKWFDAMIQETTKEPIKTTKIEKSYSKRNLAKV